MSEAKQLHTIEVNGVHQLFI